MTTNKAQMQELPEGQAFLDALKTHFGIELDAPYEALRPLPEPEQEAEPVFGF
jgi:N-hydroxyarylamine O-acetyltransferase